MKKKLKLEKAIKILLGTQNARVVRFITHDTTLNLKIKRENERLKVIVLDKKGFVLDEFSLSTFSLNLIAI